MKRQRTGKIPLQIYASFSPLSLSANRQSNFPRLKIAIQPLKNKAIRRSRLSAAAGIRENPPGCICALCLLPPTISLLLRR
ncbi:MAG TPA: hypothetical protein PKI81_14245 [bacterium]|nr:hypothetical protein [bacterium]HOY43946.1 hypothetical protein [bacterium]HPG81917.1 hypothetical protein [bacterium]HPM58229.1 hypothetical protein [bacterium]